MSPQTPTYTLLNPHTNPTPPPTPPSSFTLKTPPGTDLWRKPPSTNRRNTPFLYRPVPLAALRRARVSFSADWTVLYEQAGLLVVYPERDAEAGAAWTWGENSRWIKTGVEFYGGRANVSTVAADRWADWSLVPLSPALLGRSASGVHASDAVTVELEREVAGDGTPGPGLWVFVVGTGGERLPVREVSWGFEEEGGEEREVWVGVYVGKPLKGEGEREGEGELTVTFEGLEIDVVG
ncbi:MAG: hypothetical protein M1833_002907, partial [Piccolia ochrophora]